MFLALLPLLFSSVWAESFLYLHPANPEYHPRDVFPQQKVAPRGKIRDLPQSGIIYLNRIKPMDPFVKAFGSQNVDKKDPINLPESQEIERDQLSSITHNSIEEEPIHLPTENPSPHPTTTTEVTPADLSNDETDALDEILRSLKSDPVPYQDSKAGGDHKPHLVTLRGTRVAGSASARQRPHARLVRLDKVGSTATLKNSPEFDPWERVGQ